MPMIFKAKSGDTDYTPVPAGSHIGICDIIADLGMQPGSDQYPKPKQQVYIRFQLPNEQIEYEKDGKKLTGPQVVGKAYTASMNEKATLRHHLESWRGKQFTDEEAEAFDVSKCLGMPCMLTVMHSVGAKDKKTYANITGIGPLPKGIDKKNLIPSITPILYTPESTTTYVQLPDWLKKKIDTQIKVEPDPPKRKAQQNNGNPDSDDPWITDQDLPPEMFDADATPF
jgi:hypothetical protein